MKKNNHLSWAERYGMKKSLLIMKQTLFLLLIFVSQANAVNSQTIKTNLEMKRVSLELNNAPMTKLIQAIEQQTGMGFVYEPNMLKEAGRVTINVSNESVNAILDRALPPIGLTYEIFEQTIIIKPAPIVALGPIKVKGKVIDNNGQPLPGASIMIKGTNEGTTTDADGSYTIEAPDNAILVFTFIGYIKQEINISGRSQIDVTMAVEVAELKEVTVNAGYYTVKEKNRTGSIAKVSAKEIADQPVTNVMAAMQGRMAGVSIVQQTGVPGGGFKIEIRGRNSIRNRGSASMPIGNDPLYIVDGMPYSTESKSSDQISSGILFGGESPLNSINPNDIESIEILKDADATAIYGSRGANGVVLITTKKGKAGKTRFSVNVYSGVGKVTRTMKMMNTEQYMEMRREAFANDGITQMPSWEYDINGTWDQNRYTDWQKVLIGGTASMNNIDANVSGGSENTQFLLSGAYSTEKTVFPGDYSYKKGNVHFNLNHYSDDRKFNAALSATYTASKNNQLSMDLTPNAIALQPNAPALYKENGDLNWENGTWTNPLAYNEAFYLARNNALIASSTLSYKILPELEIKVGLGFTDSRATEIKTTPHTVYNPSYGLNSSRSSMFQNNAKDQSWNVEPQLSYIRRLGKGLLDIRAGATFMETTRNQLVNYGSGFLSNSMILNLSAATTNAIYSNNNSVYRHNALFGRINYIWDDKYIINLTGRRDGSSRFGSGKQFGNFGALGAAWIFNREEFLQKLKPFLSFGKLRGSYGTSGNDQIGDYQFLDTYSSSGVKYQGVTGMQPTRLYNPDFSWEINKKFEMALDLGFLNDRIFLTASHFINRSSNQLVGIPLPGTTGFTSIQANRDATVQNWGWELELKTDNLSGKNLVWTSMLTFTSLRNKLVSFPGLEGSTYASQYVVGKPLNVLKVYHYTGVDPTTGVYTFKDENGDGTLSSKADKKTIVSITPKFYGGFHNSFRYKNIELQFLIQYVKQTGTNFKAAWSAPGSSMNQPVSFLDRWQKPGDNKSVQRYTADYGSVYTAFSRYTYSDAIVSDASFIRLKNLSLNYTLPKSWMKTTICRLYLQAQNLLTITKYEGLDPENQSVSQLPPLRMITAGMQLSF